MADADGRAIHTIDADALEELAVTPVDGAPAELLPLADGRVLVTLRDTNRLAVLEIPEAREAPLELRCSLPTASEPWGLAVSPDGATVALTAAWDHRLTLLSSADLAPRHEIDLPAEPRGVLMSEDGRTAWVTHMIGGLLSKIALGDAPRVTVIRARPAEPPKAPPRASRSKKAPDVPPTAVQGFAIAEASLGRSGDGTPWPARVLAPMAGVHPGQFEAATGLPSSYGGSRGRSSVLHLPYVAVIDPAGERPIARAVEAVSQSSSHACSLPRAAAVDGDRLYVACLGIDQLLELDARAIDPIVAEQRRFDVAPGPAGIAIDARRGRALVASQFEAVVSVVDLSADPGKVAGRLDLARPVAPPISAKLVRGRALFHATDDGRISQDGRACASCHPEGRADGLTWITPDGPRQTIFLAGRARAGGPFGWFGDHATLRDHLRFTMKRLGGVGFERADDKADLEALVAWMEAMEAPSRAGTLIDEATAKLRERGRDVFSSSETGCAGCHLGGDTDEKRHDVGSGQVIEKSLAFDTPSLRFAAGAAPYFHDGRYATLFDLLSDPRSRMGHSASLPEADRRALAAYLESL